MAELINRCLGKIRYATKYFADAQAEAMEAKYGKPMRSYACGFCGGYHVSRK